MRLFTILADSLRLLCAEPKIYLPRIITTSIYTAFVIYTARFGVEMSKALVAARARASFTGVAPDFIGVLSGFRGSMAFFIVFFLFSYGIDIFSYGMYVRIVSDYHAKKPIKLREALNDALKKGRTLLLLSLIILAFIAVAFVLYFLLGSAFLLTQNPIYPILALGVMLLGVVGLALIFFFSIPVAMSEGKGALDVVSTSARLGLKHKGVVIKTNLMFSALIFATLIIAVLADLNGGSLFAWTAFILARIFQALVYTYISVVNPAVYIYVEEPSVSGGIN